MSKQLNLFKFSETNNRFAKGFYEAVVCEDFLRVKELLKLVGENGIGNLNETNYGMYGLPLHEAASKGYVEIVKELLQIRFR